MSEISDVEVVPAIGLGEMFGAWLRGLEERHYVRRYVKTFGPCSEAVEAYQIAGAMMSLVAVLQDRAVMRKGTHELRPNLYICICGPSSTSKKTTAMNVALQTLRGARAPVNVVNDCTPERLFVLFEDGLPGYSKPEMAPNPLSELQIGGVAVF